MKRIIALMLALILCPCVAMAEIDLSSMNYDELVSLNTKITQELAARAAMNDPDNEVSKLLYEDENVSIEFSRIWTVETSFDTYLKTEYLIRNKTDRILEIVCDNIIVDGFVVDISKYVEVPPNAMTIHEWTNGAEQYLKYKIESPSTLLMMFDYEATDNSFRSDTIMSNTISITE